MTNIVGEARRVTGDGDTMVMVCSLLKDTVSATAFGGVSGAVYGGIVGMLLARHFSLSRAQVVCRLAREYSVGFAAMVGTYSVVSEVRGKDDVTTALVAGSGYGLALSFLYEGLKVRPALFNAAGFAVMSGITYKVAETISSRNAQDAYYTEARAMLLKLGLEEYEKNFKKGHLTDYTLPLLTDRDLQEVNIPSGARLLILDHIKRYNKLVNRK